MLNALRSLCRPYTVAILAITAVSVTLYIFVHSESQRFQARTAYTADLVEEQYLLLAISTQAEQLLTEQRHPERDQLRQRLRRNIDLLSEVHQKITKAELAFIGGDLADADFLILQDHSKDLRKATEAFLAQADPLAQSNAALGARDTKNLRRLYQSALSSALLVKATLLPKNLAYSGLNISLLQAFNLAAFLGLLFWVWLFMLRPLGRKILDQDDALTNVREEQRQRAIADPITGLPNRRGVLKAIDSHLTHLELDEQGRPQKPSMVMLVNFLTISHALQTLDDRFISRLTTAIARRMRKGGHAGFCLGHLGQGQFFVLREYTTKGEETPEPITDLETEFEKPIKIESHRVQVRMAIGCHAIEGHESAEDVLANVQLARDAALRDENVPFIRYEPDLRAHSEQQLQLAGELEAGLEQGELRAHFQPQVNMRTLRVTGFEALVRWYHPARGMLSPGVFLPLAEDLGLEDLLGEVMLKQALSALNFWQENGHDVPQIGVNFSRLQLQSNKLAERLRWLLDSHDLTPERLSVEVLENIHVASENDPVLRTVRQLSEIGFRIDLDDFGTGSASIMGLRRFGADRIKIDRGFITKLESREDNQKMVSIMLNMARSLGLEVLAEGVETDAEADMLRRLGCFEIQGYHLAKPMALEDTLPWLKEFANKRGSAGRRSVAI